MIAMEFDVPGSAAKMVSECVKRNMIILTAGKTFKNHAEISKFY